MVQIREGTPTDAAAVAAITNEVIANSIAIFSEEPVTVEDRRTLIESQLAAGRPFLIADMEGEVAGFSTFTPIWTKCGYRDTVDHSIYVAAAHRGRGVGDALMHALLDRARAQGMRMMIAQISGGNDGSVRFHQRFGYRLVATLPKVAQKWGQRHDHLFMQLDLAEAAAP